jgi:2-methylcitrate dehydratase PrpD
LTDIGVTRQLARFIVESRWSDIPQDVRHEGERAILNWLGCAFGGCRDEAVERLLAALREFAGQPQATLLGRGERLDALTAACINAVSSNILDFDDTHLRTVIHPTVPVAAALLALAEYRPLSGAEFLHAFILGVDAECRIGNAVSPAHYEVGWHITATCGVFGAAVAAGKALKLDARQMAWALGIAATQASGIREVLGSMCKSYNMGHAARNGLAAALLAAGNFTSSERALEAQRGFLNVFATRSDAAEITRGLGTSWELMQNAYKPYPCGIVIHPVLDACLDLRAAHRIDPAMIAKVEVTINPLAQQLCGNKSPRNGLEGKLSLYHSAVVALLDGDAGVHQYADARVNDPRVVAFREKIALRDDAAIGKEQARVRITLTNGKNLEMFVEHARGCLQRPMSDADLSAKFRGLAAAELAPRAVEQLIEQCWSLAELPDAGAIARAGAALDV